MFVLVCIVLVLFPENALHGAKEGLRIALDTVIPSLLPFAAISGAMVYCGIAEAAGRLFLPVFRFLKLNPMGAAPFFASLLGGYPTGCKIVCDMYKEGLIDKKEGERMLSYVNNGGVIFALNVCGREFFKSTSDGCVIFLSAAAGAIVSGCIFGRSDACSIEVQKKKRLPYMAAFGKGIISSGGIFANITASFVVCYALIYAFRIDRLPLLMGVAELTGGINYAGSISSVPLGAMFFALGGVTVFTQSAAICQDALLSMKECIKGKIAAAAVAAGIAYALSRPKDVVLFALICIAIIFFALKMLRSERSIFKIIYFRGNR